MHFEDKRACYSEHLNLDDFVRPLLSTELWQEQTAFFAFQIVGGHIGLPILLFFSVISPKAQRDPTFLNFCFTWVFSSVVFSIG